MNADIKNKLFMVGYLEVLCQKAEEYYSDEKETEFNKNFSMIFEYIDYMHTYCLHEGYNQIPLEPFENIRVHKGSDINEVDEDEIKDKKYYIFFNEYRLYSEDFMYLKILANIFYSITGDRKNVYYVEEYNNGHIKEDIVYTSDDYSYKYDFLVIFKNDKNEIKYVVTSESYDGLVEECRNYPIEYELIYFYSKDRQKDKITLLKDMKEKDLTDEKQQPVKSKEETVFEVINKDDGFIFEDYLKAFELAKFFNLFYCKSDYTLIYKKTKVEILDNFKITVKLKAKEKRFVIIIEQENGLCDFVISDSYEEHFENLKKYSHLSNYILYIYESLDFGKRQTNFVIKNEKEYVKYYNDIENKVK